MTMKKEERKNLGKQFELVNRIGRMDLLVCQPQVIRSALEAGSNTVSSIY